MTVQFFKFPSGIYVQTAHLVSVQATDLVTQGDKAGLWTFTIRTRDERFPNCFPRYSTFYAPLDSELHIDRGEKFKRLHEHAYRERVYPLVEAHVELCLSTPFPK